MMSTQREINIDDKWEGTEDEGRKMKRREKNRVAAQKSRKRQTQRADKLHEVRVRKALSCSQGRLKACEHLEQRNRKLRQEVDSLSEEQRLLSDALKSHEPFCPIMHCSFSSASSSLQQDNVVTLSH